MRQIIWLLSLLFLILLIQFSIAWPDGRLRYIQCDVGQGDAVLITKNFQQILIDAGPNDKVVTCLQNYLPFWDKKIELAIASHADKDHIGGFDEMLDSYQIKTFIWNGKDNQDKTWQQLLQKLQHSKVPMRLSSQLDTVHIGDEVLTLLWPTGDVSNVPDNEASVVAKLQYGSFTVLLTGDIPVKIEKQLTQMYGKQLRSIVLKVSHHGSKTASSPEFLTEVEPMIATIGVGKNSYGHPTMQTLQNLTQIGTTIRRTDQNGDIVVASDGKSWKLEN